MTALVELQARFDEENNIVKARARCRRPASTSSTAWSASRPTARPSLVVRREHDGIRRYVHLGTGNYNPTTARLYTDLGFFTCRPEFGEDASALFNLLTGYSQGHGWKKLIVAPDAPGRPADRPDRPRARSTPRPGLPARIIAKMNSLVDPDVDRGALRAPRRPASGST